MTSRRRFLQMAGASGSLLLPGCRRRLFSGASSAHVVVIGAGFGGATAAKYIRQLDASIRVTLIEAKVRYTTCPGSNWVLGGLRQLNSIDLGYERLISRYGINLVTDWVTAVDADLQSVRLSQGETIHYDRLIMAPGIDFRWDAIEGYDARTAEFIPHAWQAGRQTGILLDQVRTMPDNGLVVISAPANPYRCPPGPYERASMLAYYCRRHKPRAKILIVDHKRAFSKQALFVRGWKQAYGFSSENSLIEWQSLTDNPVIAVAAKSKTLYTDFGDQIRADVLNIIPPQKAGKIASQAGLTDRSGWCPVNSRTSESLRVQGVHIIGDAAVQAPIPKSAFAANSEAKVCALAVVSLLNDSDPVDQPAWVNTCFSLLTADQGISVSMVYKLNEQGQISKVPGAGGVSSKTDRQSLFLESQYARSWYNSIIADSFY